jgi:ribosomal-protein-alanine N-acetyltransferase
VSTLPVVLDPLTGADAQRCAELEAILFPGDDPWPAKAFLHELAADHTHYLAARADNRLVGYAGVARLGNQRPFEYEVHTIGVDPDYQGHGIGRLLLDALLALADADDAAVFLEVRTDNVVAITMYETAGFVTIGLRKRYYQGSGADAYTMRREGAGEP